MKTKVMKKSEIIEKTTVENNRLIAEFMGIGYEEGGETRYSHESSEYYFVDVELEYHFSWDWLMSVVEKIEDLGFTSAIKTRYVRINPKENASYYNYISWVSYTEHGWYINRPYPTTDSEIHLPPKDSGKQTLNKLEATYKAVVQFIEWYNEQSETN